MFTKIATFADSIRQEKTRCPYTAMTPAYREEMAGVYAKYGKGSAMMEVPEVTWADLTPLLTIFLPEKEGQFSRMIREAGEPVVIAGSAITSTLEDVREIRNSDLDIFIQTTEESLPTSVKRWVTFLVTAGYWIKSTGKSYGRATSEPGKYDFDNGINRVVTMMNCHYRSIDLVFSVVPFERLVLKTDFMHCVSYVRFENVPEEEGGVRPFCVVSDPWAVRDRLLIENTSSEAGIENLSPEAARKRLARLDKYVARGWSAEHLPPTYRSRLERAAGRGAAAGAGGSCA